MQEGDLASEHEKRHRELATSLYEREALKVRDTSSGNDPEMGNQLVKRLVGTLTVLVSGDSW